MINEKFDCLNNNNSSTRSRSLHLIEILKSIFEFFCAIFESFEVIDLKRDSRLKFLINLLLNFARLVSLEKILNIMLTIKFNWVFENWISNFVAQFSFSIVSFAILKLKTSFNLINILISFNESHVKSRRAI